MNKIVYSMSYQNKSIMYVFPKQLDNIPFFLLCMYYSICSSGSVDKITLRIHMYGYKQNDTTYDKKIHFSEIDNLEGWSFTFTNVNLKLVIPLYIKLIINKISINSRSNKLLDFNSLNDLQFLIFRSIRIYINT